MGDYHCVPKKSDCGRTWHCQFSYLDEEHLLRTRDSECNIPVEKLYIVDEETKKRVDVIKTMEW